MSRGDLSRVLGIALLVGCAPGGGSGVGEAGVDGGPGAADGATASCEDVVCGTAAHCEDGACVCNAGLVLQGLDCVGEPLPEMGERTEALVCARWAADHVEVAPEWTPTGGDCDLGEVAAGAQDNAIRRTNLYRWLVGLEPLELEPSLLEGVQACSVIQSAQGSLDHNPPMGAPCWTRLGAETAAMSNLSLGSGMAGSVDAYVFDGGVPSLGHRRWVLNPQLRRAAFGLVGRGSCMHVFTMDAAAPVEFVAWPPPGYVPLAAARGRWSFATFGARQDTGETRIEVSVDGGAPVAVDHEVLGGGFGGARSTLAWDPPGDPYRHGTTVDVTVYSLTDGDLSYTLRFTDCGG